MMTLQEFIEHLKIIDSHCEEGTTAFNHNAREVKENHFKFDFDGFMVCAVRFNKDSSVDEWVDCIEEENFDDKAHHAHYATIDKWLEKCISDINVNE